MKKICSWINIYVLLAVFGLIYSVGIFYNLDNAYIFGDESHVIFAVLKFFRDFNFADPYTYAFAVNTILYVPFTVLAFVGSFVFGFVDSPAELKELVITKQYIWFAWMRFVTVTFSLVCLWLTYRISQFLFKDKKWSLLVVYLLGTALVFTKISFVAIKWIPQLMMMLAALYYFFYLVKQKQWQLKHYITSACLIAAGYGVAMMGSLMIVPWLVILRSAYKNKQTGNIKKGLVWFFIILIVLVALITVASPTLALGRFEQFISIASSGAVENLRDTAPLYRVYGYIVILFKTEPLLFVLSIIGAIIALIKKRNVLVTSLVVYFLTYYIILGPLLNAVRQRRMVLFLPIMAILATVAFKWIKENIKPKFIGSLLVFILAVLFVINPFLIQRELRKPLNQSVARHWIEDNLPTDSIIFDECSLSMEESQEKMEYIQNNRPELLTSKQSYILQHPYIFNERQGFFVVIDPAVGDKEYLAANMDKDQYFVYCFMTTFDTDSFEEEFNKRINYFEFNRLYDSFTLEEVYDSTTNEKVNMANSHFLVKGTDLFYLFRHYNRSVHGEHVRIYKINSQ